MDNNPTAGDGGVNRPNLPDLNINLGAVLAASRVYIIEHFVVLIMLVLVLVSGIGLFNTVIDHLIDSGGPVSPYSSIVQFEQLALYISMAVVAIPVFSVFYIRTRKAERNHPEIFKSRPRRRLGYLFMAIAALFMAGYTIAFVYTTALAVINAEAQTSGESWIHTSLKQIFAIAFIGLVVMFVARLTPGIDEEVK